MSNELTPVQIEEAMVQYNNFKMHFMFKFLKEAKDTLESLQDGTDIEQVLESYKAFHIHLCKRVGKL